MGFFSYHTCDTGESIPNTSCSSRKTFCVYLMDDKGNVWKENEYEGYGVFGGKDIYVLFAEMNGLDISEEQKEELKAKTEKDEYGYTEYEECLRSLGIDKWHEALQDEKIKTELKFPILVRNKSQKWENKAPEHCKAQGFFY